jgi:hypothetical protein
MAPPACSSDDTAHAGGLQAVIQSGGNPFAYEFITLCELVRDRNEA